MLTTSRTSRGEAAERTPAGRPAGAGETRVWLDVATLRGGLSPRVNGVNTAYVRQLAELAQELPPLVVHRETLRVVDGTHRLEAARARGDHRVRVVFFDGTDSEAFVAAVRMNSAHGRPLAPADRTAAVERILASEPERSDRWIATVCGVAPRTVAGLRRRSTADGARLNTRIGKDGRRRPVSAAEGRRTAAAILSGSPATSLREVARRADISVGTALDVRRSLAAAKEEKTLAHRTAPAPAVTVRATPPAGEPDETGARKRLEALQRDPSLQYTERGRALLQLVSATLGFLDQAGEVADTAPAHCREALRTVALACADGWRGLGEQLDAR